MFNGGGTRMIAYNSAIVIENTARNYFVEFYSGHSCISQGVFLFI
jgi:hypothetical protein